MEESWMDNFWLKETVLRLGLILSIILLEDDGSMHSRWFKVTFWSPSWRSLSHLKGSLNHPKKVTLNHQVWVVSFCLLDFELDVVCCFLRFSHPSKNERGPFAFSKTVMGIGWWGATSHHHSGLLIWWRWHWDEVQVRFYQDQITLTYHYHWFSLIEYGFCSLFDQSLITLLLLVTTVDGKNPKQAPPMVLTPCKQWDKLPTSTG